MPDENLRYEVVEGAAIVTLNDPERLNALSPAMGEALLAAVRQAQTEARALLITSVGRAFCAGLNLEKGGFDLQDPERDVGLVLEHIFNPLALEFRASRIPVVAAVRGAAAGVGCSIALSADLIIAGESGYFLQAFRHIGLAGDGGSSYLLANAIGRVRAMEMMLLGNKLPAKQALEWGMINRMVSDDMLDAEAAALVAALAKGPASLGIIRKLGWSALDADFTDQLAMERQLQREAGRTDDFVEGVTAFREKRPPVFTGK